MCCLPKNEALTDTLKTKTSAKQTEKETEQNYCGKIIIIKKDETTQMQLNEKWLP